MDIHACASDNKGNKPANHAWNGVKLTLVSCLLAFVSLYYKIVFLLKSLWLFDLDMIFSPPPQPLNPIRLPTMGKLSAPGMLLLFCEWFYQSYGPYRTHWKKRGNLTYDPRKQAGTKSNKWLLISRRLPKWNLNIYKKFCLTSYVIFGLMDPLLIVDLWCWSPRTVYINGQKTKIKLLIPRTRNELKNELVDNCWPRHSLMIVPSEYSLRAIEAMGRRSAKVHGSIVWGYIGFFWTTWQLSLITSIPSLVIQWLLRYQYPENMASSPACWCQRVKFCSFWTFITPFLFTPIKCSLDKYVTMSRVSGDR